MTDFDVAIRDGILGPDAVESVIRDYDLLAPSLERAEVQGLEADIGAGRRNGLVGVAGASRETPVSLPLYMTGSDGSTVVKFVHVMAHLQNSVLEGRFLKSAVVVLQAKGSPEITVEAFVGGTASQVQRHLAVRIPTLPSVPDGMRSEATGVARASR